MGVWSANFGNGGYTGTVSIDKAFLERSHLILDVDNFTPKPKDLDHILLGSGAEVRLKKQEKPEDKTKLFFDAFTFLKQKSYTPNPAEFGEELLLFRYLIHGLDYIPCANADNSKRKMKAVWPSKAEEDNIGTSDNEKLQYRLIFPASVRSAMTMMSFARALREYTKAAKPEASPTVMESLIASFKLIGAYSGMIDNPQRVREDFVGNPYRAAGKIADIIQDRLIASQDLREALIHYQSKQENVPSRILDECKADYACFKE